MTGSQTLFPPNIFGDGIINICNTNSICVLAVYTKACTEIFCKDLYGFKAFITISIL